MSSSIHLCWKLTMFLNAHPLRLTVLAAALAAALPALAQQTPKPAAPEPIQKVEVKGAADAYDARRDDTASKIVLNHDEIVKFGDTNVLDVLKRLPGVTVSGASGRGGGEVRMRGLGSGYTQILVNGERAPAGFSMDSLAPDSIERIEVLRAATAEFSTQSIAGTINIVLKKAMKTAQRELKLSLGGGRDTFTPTVNLQMSDKKGAFSYSLTVNAVHSMFDRVTPSTDEFTDAAGAVSALRSSAFHEKGSFSGLNIGPRLNWTYDNGDTLTSQTFINVGRFSRNSDTVVTAAPSSAAGSTPYLDWDMVNLSKSFRTDLNWVKKLGDGAKLDLKIGGVLAAGRNDSYRDGYLAKDGFKTLDGYTKSRVTERGFTSTGKYSTPLGAGHALSVGWDGGYTTREDLRLQDQRRFIVPTQTTPAPGYIDEPVNEVYSSDVTRFAGYAQDEWNVTPQWSVYMGVRWEGIRTDVADTHILDSQSRTSVWSPLFQTLYKLPGTKGDQLRFALTRTYKAPSIQNITPRRFLAANNGPTEPDFIGNAALKPELATGIDASYEHYWGKGAMVSVSASVRRLTDYTRNEVDQDAEGYFTRPINDGTATTRGLEFEAKFPLKSVYETAPPIDIRFNMSRNWSSVSAVDGPHNRLDQQTPFSATLGADYKAGALTAGASYSFRNGGPVRISATQSAYTTPRRDLEMYGLWKFDPKNQLRVGLTNILAQDYISENTFVFDDGGAVRRNTVTPGEAQLRVTLERKF
jgi:outer membrane receptor for ferrienterochelin and colicins